VTRPAAGGRRSPERPAGRAGVLARLASLAGVLACALGVWATPAGAAGNGSAPPSRPSLTVIGQDPYAVGPHGIWTIDLALPRNSTGRVEVSLYPRLYTRTAFRQSLTGDFNSSPDYYSGALKVSDLPAVGGGVQLRLPINPAGGLSQAAGMLQPAYLSSTNFGVYPMQIGMVNASGSTVGRPITTYLVWVPGPTGLPRLSVSWVLPVQASPAVEPPGYAKLNPTEMSDINAEIRSLASHPTVPVSLQVEPQVAAALSNGGPAGRATLAALGGLAGDPYHQILPATYVPVDLPSLATSGLTGEIGDQVTAGANTLRTLLHASPSNDTWAVNGPMDPTTVSVLRARGATRLVVPDSDLRTFSYNFTFARPVLLTSNPGVEAVGADTGLESHFTNRGDQVLQGEQLLAELAMIDSETPGQTRGVAILAPQTWTPSADFIDTVLGGLHGNPLLQATTVDQLFSSVPPATADGQTLARSLTDNHPAPFPGTADVHRGRRELAALAATYPGATAMRAELDRRLLALESSTLSTAGRFGAMKRFDAAVDRQLGKVAVPPNVSLTLTARNGTLPLTVVDRGPVPARVVLRLTSQKLNFRPFTPPAGTCQTSATAVTCQLRISGPVAALKVPVQTRTTGVFSLLLTLRAPGSAVSLSQARYTVRSTAVSLVAVVLMIGAGLLLVVWWIRDRRHGHRARHLIEPVDQAEGDDEPPADHGDRVNGSATSSNGRHPGDGRSPQPVEVPHRSGGSGDHDD
jgi:hypothetical protein